MNQTFGIGVALVATVLVIGACIVWAISDNVVPSTSGSLSQEQQPLLPLGPTEPARLTQDCIGDPAPPLSAHSRLGLDGLGSAAAPSEMSAQCVLVTVAWAGSWPIDQQDVHIGFATSSHGDTLEGDTLTVTSMSEASVEDPLRSVESVERREKDYYVAVAPGLALPRWLRLKHCGRYFVDVLVPIMWSPEHDKVRKGRSWVTGVVDLGPWCFQRVRVPSIDGDAPGHLTWSINGNELDKSFLIYEGDAVLVQIGGQIDSEHVLRLDSWGRLRGQAEFVLRPLSDDIVLEVEFPTEVLIPVKCIGGTRRSMEIWVSYDAIPGLRWRSEPEVLEEHLAIELSAGGYHTVDVVVPAPMQDPIGAAQLYQFRVLAWAGCAVEAGEPLR